MSQANSMKQNSQMFSVACRLPAIGAVFTLLLLASSAHATPSFPGVIREETGGSGDPSCQVCHDGPTRVGTVTRAFGAALRERGLVLYNEGSLKAALVRLRNDKVDSDGDGLIDVDALKAGKDPNGEAELGALTDATPRPGYGCVGRIAPTPPYGSAPVVAGLVAIALLAFRRKHKR
jgi:hypothetical protein